MVLILLFIFLLVVAGWYRFLLKGPGALRVAVLLGAVTWGVALLLGTEFLSLLHALSFWPIVCWWLVVSGLAAIVAWPFFTHQIFRSSFPSLDRWETFLLCALGLTLALTAMVAFWAPPNTWDSMTYHMPRVMHWIQNHSIDHYPTSILRQLNYPALGSYGILHLQILTGTDHWANFIQWSAMSGTLIGVSLIAFFLGGTRTAQIIAALMAATIPMGILQSTSTQTDYLSAFMLVAFVCIGLMFVHTGQRRFIFFSGLALGLGFFVKGTVYFFGVSLLVWLVILTWRKQGIRGARWWIGAIILAALVNIPYYFRNIALTGTLIPPSESTHIFPNFLPAVFIENVIQNFTGHWILPWASTNDVVFHEDCAGNILPLVTYIASGVLFVLKKRRGDKVGSGGFVLAVVSGFLLYMLLLKYQHAFIRYHLPVLILLAPWAAVVWTKWSRRWAKTIATIFFVAGVPWMLWNYSRPLIGESSVLCVKREQQYFANWHAGREMLSILPESLGECKNVGLVMGEDSWEYPFWYLTRAMGGVRLEHVKVDNISAKLKYPLGAFEPCALILDGSDEQKIISYENKPFFQVAQGAGKTIYRRLDYMPLEVQKTIFEQIQGKN